MPIYHGGYSLTEDLPRRVVWSTDTDWNKGTLGNDTEVSGTGVSAVIRPNSYNVPADFIYLTWAFNETTGTVAADSSQYGRDGTLVTYEGYNPAQWVAGKLNNALSNPGEYESNDYVEGGNIAGFEWNDSFSVECWFNQAPGYDSVLAGNFDLTEVKGWHLGIQEGYLRMALIGGPENILQTYSTTVVTPNTYQHLVVTYDGTGLASGVKFYLDGLLLTNSVYSDTLAETSIVPTANNFHAGAIPAIGGWIGQLDAFSVYTKVLTQTEVDSRYNTGSGTESPLALDIWYKTTAHYETNIFDSNVTSLIWGTLGAIKALPAGTTLSIKARASNDSDTMGSYGSAIVTGSSLGVTGRYIQFSVDFTGTVTERSVLEYISALYAAPTIQDVTP